MRKKINSILIIPFRILLFISMFAMVLLVLMQVIFRHLNISVVWTEEVARIFFVWMMTFGLVLIENENRQTSTELFTRKMSPKTYVVFKGIITILECIFMCVLFVGSIKSIPQVKIINLGTIRALDYRILYYPMIISSPFVIWFLVNQWLDVIENKGIQENAELPESTK